MADPLFILFPRKDGWRIGVMRDGEPELRELPSDSDVTAALRELGYAAKRGVILAVPSAWCFAATIDTSDLPGHDGKALVYRLEEKLPIPAEEFVADFCRDSLNALGIAVRISQVKPIIDELARAGVAVQSIVPAALLAAQAVEPPSGDQPHASFFTDDDATHLVITCGGHALNLATFPNDPERRDLALDLAAISCGLDRTALLANITEAALAPAAIRGAAAIERGKAAQWIELRRDALAAGDRLGRHRRALDAVLAAVAVLLIAIAGASLIRAHRYQLATGHSERQIADEFRRAFPGWETPASVKSVIQSERRKLALSSPARSASLAQRSALFTLQSVLGSLPAGSRFALDRMIFEDVAFELEGRAVSLDGMSGITNALRGAGWDLPQPQGHRDGDGFWSFTIRGSHDAAGAPLAVREEPSPP